MDTNHIAIDKNKTVLTGVRITLNEKEIVDAYMYKTGSLSFSATLRVIIREWAELKAEEDRKDKRGSDGN